MGMTDKERTSISVDKDVYEYLQQSSINQSGLINDLVRNYKDNEELQVAALELRYQHLIDEAEEHEERADRKREKAAEVKELLEEAKASGVDGIEDARDGLAGVPEGKLTPGNPAVQNWADKLGVTPTALLEQL